MTKTDAAFTARFSPETVSGFVANQSTLSDYTPTASPLNTGLMSDIGRATVYAPDVQPNFWARYIRDPLARGEANLKAMVDEVTSRAYNPEAPDTDLFNGQQPGFKTNVAKKNFSRQIAVEINDYMLKQFAQTPEQIGYMESAIMAVSNACWMDDMWVASKAYFSGTTNGAKTGQMAVMTNPITDAVQFGAELNELIWQFVENKFAFKSTLYNAAGRNTRSTDVSVVLRKDTDYPAFKKLLSDLYNPDMLRIAASIDFVDDFATPAGKPLQSGELLGMIIDNRAFDIVPMPSTMTTEAFRNPARKSTAYFTTYEYAFQNSPEFNIAYIFAPGGA